jgi:beta-lactamase regulating signal transducer with metallopeptidase domain
MMSNALGWTLVHSLWEGALIALLLVMALSLVRSSRGRYALASIAMIGVLATFCGTFARLMTNQPSPYSSIIRPGSHAGYAASAQGAHMTERSLAADVIPWLTPCWIAGVIVFHLHLLASWLAGRRLRRRGVCGAPDVWQERLSQLARRIRLAAPVTLLESALANVPVVLGYLRPVILVPAGLLSGMPAQQMEAILLHELAHILRRDYLVNLLQTIVEGFLFYHPAVWWISGVIRTERENCCDDLVVAISGEPREYAAALAALEQTRWATADAVAANGGNLMKRIRRLLYPLEAPRPC